MVVRKEKYVVNLAHCVCFSFHSVGYVNGVAQNGWFAAFDATFK